MPTGRSTDRVYWIWLNPLRGICRSIDYHLQGPHAYQGGHWVIFAALQAFAGLSSPSPVAEWLERVLRVIAKDSGFAIAEAMLEKGLQSSPKVMQS